MKQLTERVDNLNLKFSNSNTIIKEFSTKGFKQQEFLKTGKSPLIGKFDEQISEVRNNMEFIENNIPDQKTLRDQIEQLKSEIEKFETDFSTLTNVYIRRGFQDYGIEGELRKAIHDVEDSDLDFDKAQMLMLRRHEKDFFLRKDLKYVSKFNADTEKFKTSVYSIEGGTDLIAFIDVYHKKFNEIVNIEEQIGLTSEDGILGKLTADTETIGSILNNTTNSVKEHVSKIINSAVLILIGLFVLQLIVGAVLVLFYSNILTKSIKEVRSAMTKLANGSFPDTLTIKSKDELGQTKVALNNLVLRMHAAVDFAKELGNGNFEGEYDEKYNDDVLAVSIISMQEKLITSEKEQKIISWSNEGLARFADILNMDFESLETMGDKIVNEVVNRLKINQAALYLLDKDSNILNRVSTYAYSKKKFLTGTVDVGEGLVGQCVLEKEKILMTDVPDGYTTITSGLGEATPSAILIMPLKIRDEVIGVLELASFHVFETQEIQFVEKVSENIANVLVSKRMAEKTKALLTESQQKAEALASQEEELRQNAEEMQATQEEMERQRAELNEKIEKLESELYAKNQHIVNLEDKLLRNRKKEKVFEN
ncbi:GAF domain-containing protein [Fulvivirga sp.]|uniref:GAF domain-containing protein n=1 Tax=Fulvivirga sp. TaxID=1931237 RepID=UPI0032EEA922